MTDTARKQAITRIAVELKSRTQNKIAEAEMVIGTIATIQPKPIDFDALAEQLIDRAIYDLAKMHVLDSMP